MGKLGSLFKRNSSKKDTTDIEIPKTQEIKVYPPIYDGKPVPPTEYKNTSITQPVIIRRNGTPPPIMAITNMEWNGPENDVDTMIIRYSKRSMLGYIQGEIRRHKHHSATSFIDQWIDTDVFINIDMRPPRKGEPRKWQCVAYECAEDNHHLDAVNRFPNSVVVTVDLVNPDEVNKQTPSIDTLFIGR